MNEQKEFKVTFDSVFTKMNTERVLKAEESYNIVSYYAAKHIRKNLAKVLFKQKFGVAALQVNSSVYKKTVNVRTKTKRGTKQKILKKFFFKLPEGTKIPE
jgi:ribosomal protein L23